MASSHQYEDAAWGDDGYDEADEDIQPSHMQHSDEQAQDAMIQISHVAGDSAPNDKEGSYDPASLAAPLTALPKKQPSPSAPKPKTSGGFIVGSSDEEDSDDDVVPLVVAQGRSGPAQVPAPVLSTHAPATVPQVKNGAFGGVTSPAVPPANARIANDPVVALEERVKDDPRGDMDGWLALLAEYRRRNKIPEIRNVYDRFLDVFPQAADIWVQYIEWELELSNFVEAEQLFGKSLLSVPNVQLWTVYLNYIRRRNDLMDGRPEARQTLSQSYEFVLDNIGVDKDSGKIWLDYVQFIRSGPGQIGGSNWQDQQKMDQLRKAYQRAVCMPVSTVNQLWKEYDQFEMGLNKMTGRKFIQERSPSYMSAKGANMALENLARNLHRSTLPRLQPAPGFEGDQEYLQQVELWKKWLAWEKDDPLVLKSDEPESFKQRVIYCYKQALMALRFYPEMWVDAAEWCFENGVFKDGRDLGLEFLVQGIAANPESVLLALKHADRMETTHPIGEGDEAKVSRGAVVRAPYDKVLATLYDMSKVLRDREAKQVAKIEADAKQQALRTSAEPNEDDEDPYATSGPPKSLDRDAHVEAVKKGFSVQQDLISRTISFVWIALARAMRRIQGKGTPGAKLGGLRQVFTDARQRGKLTSDVYVAVALIESIVYKDPVGPKIFERGAKLFPEDASFMIEYLKFLHSKDDTTNARVVFETCVNRLTQKPDSAHKSKSLYAYFHKYESQYGELSQIAKLEKRMAELFPDDPKLAHFSARFTSDRFDPIATRIIVSPAVQLRPKVIMPSIEQPASIRNSPLPPAPQGIASPRPQYLRATNSPKRPFPDDVEELNRPRKLARGESPLKGAAGRRLGEQRRNQGAPLPRDITFLIGILPPPETYNSTLYNPSKLVRMLQETSVPDYSDWRTKQDQGIRYGNGPPPRPSSGAPHTRQPSGSDYPTYGTYGSRDSPNPPGPSGARPLSPYDGTGRRFGSGGYRNSPLARPGSAGSYEPPPAAGYRQDAPAPMQYPPTGGHPDVVGAPSWPPPAGGYAAPPPQGYPPYRY